MSFLTPLYLLGALAIGLPILAHLIRRTPPRRQEFSSVLFLTPSVPVVTRRSRIEHWFLLCLRALVIGLLAFAFARPLWRTPVIADEARQSHWAAVLVDTSASLRRDGLWDEARRELDKVLSEFGPTDHVGVYTFDGEPKLVWSWDAWWAHDPAQRAAVAAAALQETIPTWRETNLAAALITAAESLERESARESGVVPLEIVVISDMQSGSRLDALLGYVWPEKVPVRLVRVGADASQDNAGLQPAAQSDDVQRVRVRNADGAQAESFTLQWTDSRGARISALREPEVPDETEPAVLDVVVPAGQSRIVRAPAVPESVDLPVLTLRGDAHLFDNACYVVVPRLREIAVAYLGSDDPLDPAEQRFYVEPLFADTSRRDVTIIDWNPQSPVSFPAETPIRLVLVTEVPGAEQIGPLRDYVRAGGLLIDVLRTPESAAGLASLLGTEPIAAQEADVNGFSLLTDVDFDHPALAPFADPRFSDFTTLHFWKHRRIDTAVVPRLRVLARFDDGDVAIGEVPLGDGRIVFFTSGWSRGDSQLAVWSKFVPLMNGLLETAGSASEANVQLTVGDPISWRVFHRHPGATLNLTRPDGTTEPLSEDAEDPIADRPGFYRISTADDAAPLANLAANLAAAESETFPLADDQLEALGIPLTAPQRETTARPGAELQLANAELEQHQRLWWWILLAVVALLLFETVWAGRLTRRNPAAG